MIVIHAGDFRGGLKRFHQVSNGGELFDVKSAADADTFYQRVDAFGEAGREEYYFRNYTTDILLPLSLTPALVFFVQRATRNWRSRWLRRLVGILPWMYLGFDFLENGLVMHMLSAYPERLDFLAANLKVITVLKRIGVIGAVIVSVFAIPAQRILQSLVARV
jgi:hypothetical protein